MTTLKESLNYIIAITEPKKYPFYRASVVYCSLIKDWFRKRHSAAKKVLISSPPFNKKNYYEKEKQILKKKQNFIPY